MKSAYEMTPEEILLAKKTSGCAFIPVSPCFEWHSFHLPVGTDALISERICELIAEKVCGIYFKPLSFGIDEYRSADQLLAWGFKKKDKIFGMNFPELPLSSEYCHKEEMVMAADNRLNALKKSEFKTVFIVNNHGGDGQEEILEKVCRKWNSKNFRVEYASTGRFCTLKIDFPGVGGHAGFAETLWIMAFRPDLVNLAKVPKGELNVRKTGILHYKPTIEEKYNPRNISKTVSDELRENIVNNFVEYIKKEYLNNSK